MLHKSEIKGISFGLVSGVITTLGMMIGLDVGTSSRITVMLGVVTIAFADGLSDALGVHVSEESSTNSERKLWKTTIAAFLSKFLFTISFIIPLMIFELSTAIITSIIYGLILITGISYLIAERQKKSKLGTISEHVFITVSVIIISYFIGKTFANL